MLWDINKILTDVNDSCSFLYEHYANFQSIVKFKCSYLVLFYEDRTISSVIKIDKDQAEVISGHKLDSFKDVVNTFSEQNLIVENGDDIFLGLSNSDSYLFGALILKDCADTHSINNDIFTITYKKLIKCIYSYIDTGFYLKDRKKILNVENATISYNTDKYENVAVDHVSFSVRVDDFLIIIGPSGCGKTSLLNAIGSLVKPQHGNIMWRNNDICKYNNKQSTNYRRYIAGYIYQNYNLIQDLTALENVDIAANLVRDPLSSKDVLKSVGLENKMKSFPNELSGGEQQRVCVSRALVKNSKILLCDEPTGALDVENAWQIMEVLQNLAATNKMPVIVITHNTDFAPLANHLIHMQNGKIISDVYNPFAYPAKELKSISVK